MDRFRASVGLAMTVCALGCTRANPAQTLTGIGKDGTLQVVSAQSSHSLAGGGSLGPSAMFVQVDLVLGNQSDGVIPVFSQSFSVETSDGKIYQGASFWGTSSACMEGAFLAVGSARECVVLFEVPAPSQTRELHYLMPDRSMLSVSLDAPCTDCTTTPSPSEKCGAATACNAGSYSECSLTGAVCAARFLTSDGHSFACASCSDCQTAAAQVAGWCSGGTTPSGDAACAAMSDASECGSCCQTNHPTGASRWISLVTTCECTNPGDCSFECETTLCAGQTAVDATCSSCLQTTLVSGGDCDVSSACDADVNCAPYLACINACP